MSFTLWDGATETQEAVESSDLGHTENFLQKEVYTICNIFSPKNIL